MPITLAETKNSRSGDLDRRTIKYFVRGTDDDTAAIQHVNNSADVPLTWAGLPRSGIVIEQLADEFWQAEVNYGRRENGEDPGPTGSITYSFETSVETVHITHSLGTVQSYVASGFRAKNYKQGIGPTEDGGYTGVDIPIAVSSFSYAFKFASGTLTDSYILAVESAVGRWNDRVWRGRAEGEVLLAGVSGSQGTSETPTLQFRFKRRPNVDNLQIGDVDGIAKRGWDYLQVFTEREAQDSEKLVSVAKQVNVEQVLRNADFLAILGF